MSEKGSLIDIYYHILVGSAITIACLLGNVPLLWIFARNKQTLKKKLFEVSFAVVDIVACTLQIHTIPFIEGSLGNLIYDGAPLINAVQLSITIFCMAMYTFLCLGVSIDRFIAVYFPIGYSAKRPKFLKAWVIGCIFVSAIFDVDTLVFMVSGVYSEAAGLNKVFMLLFCFSITGFVYICIICKLWKMESRSSNQVVPLSTLQSTSHASTDNPSVISRCDLSLSILT